MENLPFSPPNILLVDDVNADLVILAEIIRKAGLIARPVTSARQAVNAIEALPPNLILMDISMPEIDGFVFCAMLKKNANTKDIPIIFISALNTYEDKIKGFRAGAVDYIVKPFEVEEVMLRINTHLQMYKMQQELEVYNRKLYKIINDQIRKLYDEQKNVTKALVKVAQRRDTSNAMHFDLIGKNSKILAMSLQISPKYRNLITNGFIDAIELAAPLHDIGKIITEESSLCKAAGDPEELDDMQSHTTIGASLLEDIYSTNQNNDFLKLAIDIARYHHENWNGSGHPSGLKGAEIPLCARIVGIINEYDLLINSTIYGQAYSHQESVDMINRDSGIRFDPDIIIIFNKIQHQLKS
jgi:Response regulator containing a CheY-like receiver domain and an HD-GYP domain